MSKRHYHVLFGLQGGYMPESNEMFTTIREAERYAAALAQDWREQGERVKGNAQSGLYLVGDWWLIEITTCYEEECIEELEGENDGE